MPLLLIIFILIPVIEISLFIKVGELIGVFPTIMAVFASAAVGIMLIKRQGFSTLMRANAKIEKGEVPANEVVEGFLLGFSGVLLILPGFFTDFLGLFCLIPYFRRHLARRLIRKGTLAGGTSQFFYFNSTKQPGAHNTFEGEFSREKDPHPADLPKLKKK